MEKDKTEHYKITKELESLKESILHKEIQSQNTETLEMMSSRYTVEIEQAIERKKKRQQTFLSFVDERRQEILESC